MRNDRIETSAGAQTSCAAPFLIALAAALAASCTGQLSGSEAGGGTPAPGKGNAGDMGAEQGAPGNGPPRGGATGMNGGGASGSPLPVLPPSGAAKACTTPQVLAPMVRRLSRLEYDNTVAALLGDATGLARSFTADEKVGIFDGNVTAPTPELQTEQYLEAAEKLAAAAAANLAPLLPCDPQAGEPACARQFVTTFGRKAYRRPLSSAEIDGLVKVYEVGRALRDFRLGVQSVLEAMLQSPHFLYRFEVGRPMGKAGVLELDSHQTASRLSYLLWAGPPDDALAAAADAGALRTPEGVATQARRMLESPRFDRGLAAFHSQWLEIDAFDTVDKDRKLFPDFDAGLVTAMREETDRFVSEVARSRQPTLDALLTAPFTYASGRVARLYGVTTMGGGDGLARRELNPTQRAGLLTHASVLAKHAKPDQTSPVLRGKLVREALFCQVPPPPPPEVDNTAPAPSPNLPTRERFAQHRADPACAGCHQLMDPVGFGFESLDPIGRHRTMDAGRPVDARGDLVGTDVDGPFNGPVELSKRLVASRTVASCYTVQWARFAFAMSDVSAINCSLGNVAQSFVAGGHNLKELLVTLATSDAMRLQLAAAP